MGTCWGSPEVGACEVFCGGRQSDLTPGPGRLRKAHRCTEISERRTCSCQAECDQTLGPKKEALGRRKLASECDLPPELAEDPGRCTPVEDLVVEQALAAAACGLFAD